MKVYNPSGSEVKFDLYGYGKVVVPAGKTVEIPGFVWDVLQDPNLWGGRKCQLEIYVPPKEPSKDDGKNTKGGKK